jgi:hypothetical protein
MCVVGILIVLVVAVGVIYLQNLDSVEDEPFDCEERYDSTVLNNMGVIYENQVDIHGWNNGYSESDNCPWSAEHNGLDFMFTNNSVVIAATPGIVLDIELRYLEGTDFYVVGVQIQFNDSIIIGYGFEGTKSDGSRRAQQAAMLDIEIGDWVSKGDQIGRFLRNGQFDHIHFSVYENWEAICPRRVMGETDFHDLESLVHSYRPNWDVCYP